MTWIDPIFAETLVASDTTSQHLTELSNSGMENAQMIKLKQGKYYVRFRHNGQDIMVVTDAKNLLEAKRIAVNVKFVIKTGNWDILDDKSLRVVLRLFQNRGWIIPSSILPQIKDLVQSDISLHQAALLLYKDPIMRTQSARYKERLKQCFKHLYEFRGPGVNINSIDIRFVKEYVAHRLAQNAATDTVRRERTALSQIFDILVEQGIVSSNPVKLLKWRPNKKSKVERRPFLSLSDFRMFVSHLPDFYRPIAEVAYYTGARQGELRCLTLTQLDLPGRMIRLSNADTKEGSAKRIPLRTEAMETLNEVIKSRPTDSQIDRVFLKDASPLEPYHFKRPWERARAASGFHSLRFHDLRHVWKTNAITIDRGIRMAILGHSGGTHEGYGILTDARLLEAVDSIDFEQETHSYGL